MPPLEFQVLQERLQTFSESMPGILRRSKLMDELADEIGRMLPSSKSGLLGGALHAGRRRPDARRQVNADQRDDRRRPGHPRRYRNHRDG